MGVCGSKIETPSTGTASPSIRNKDYTNNKTKKNNITRSSTPTFSFSQKVREASHIVPFQQPQEVGHVESSNFNIVFLVQFSQFMVNLVNNAWVFCNITWDYEQFQTSVIPANRNQNARWDDHVLKYACNQKRLTKAKVVLQVKRSNNNHMYASDIF